MDPRMSTPGAGFLAWTMAVYGERHTDYWERLKPNILTLAPGWDAGYGLFVAGGSIGNQLYHESGVSSGIRTKFALQGTRFPEGIFVRLKAPVWSGAQAIRTEQLPSWIFS